MTTSWAKYFVLIAPYEGHLYPSFSPCVLHTSFSTWFFHIHILGQTTSLHPLHETTKPASVVSVTPLDEKTIKAGRVITALWDSYQGLEHNPTPTTISLV